MGDGESQEIRRRGTRTHARSGRGDPKYADFLHDVRGEPSLVYMFTGNDEFLKREALKKITEALVPPEARQFNCQSFLGAESSWSDVEAACLSAPLFAEKRVVALMGMELLEEADLAGLVAYARRPSSSTCLVALSGSASEEGRRRGAGTLARILAAAAEGVAAYTLWPRNIRDCRAWARDWLRSRGRTMSEGLLAQVMEAHGHSAYEVWNVLEKACALAGTRADITKDDVVAVGGAASVSTAEEFRRAVAFAEKEAAQRNAVKCMEAGAQATFLLWCLNRAFRHALRGLGETAESAPTGVSGPPKGTAGLRWPERRDVEALRSRFDGPGLCRAIALLCETEKGIKSGALEARLGLEVLINELTEPRSLG